MFCGCVLARSCVGAGPGCRRWTRGPLVAAYAVTELACSERGGKPRVPHGRDQLCPLSGIRRYRYGALEGGHNCETIRYI